MIRLPKVGALAALAILLFQLTIEVHAKGDLEMGGGLGFVSGTPGGSTFGTIENSYVGDRPNMLASKCAEYFDSTFNINASKYDAVRKPEAKPEGKPQTKPGAETKAEGSQLKPDKPADEDSKNERRPFRNVAF